MDVDKGRGRVAFVAAVVVSSALVLGGGLVLTDRDGTIGLLDAHTWARIEAVSIDVPTTTSERWLERHAAHGLAAIDPQLSPEDMAVVERLGAALGLSDERAARWRWDALAEELGKLGEQTVPIEVEFNAVTAQEKNALLERWPVLGDPFHPDFDATLKENRDAIEQLLSSSPMAQQRAALDERLRGLREATNRAWVEEARVFRVVRAYENLHRAAALMRSGGANARYYQTLLACERGAL
ncbi:MAG TPA: hypothetical protein VMG12_19680 [Polyangiaceae bacterium]|nr:hypothetical protein [Polyangiaceae bacterium]